MQTKTCNKCKETKAVGFFEKPHNTCKGCRYKAKREKLAERKNKDWEEPYTCGPVVDEGDMKKYMIFYKGKAQCECKTKSDPEKQCKKTVKRLNEEYFGFYKRFGGVCD